MRLANRGLRLPILAAVAIMASLVTAQIVAAQDEEPDPEQTLSRAEDILDRAEIVLEMARSTAEQSAAILDFIQTGITIGGVIVALTGGALAAAGLRTLSDYRRRLDESANRLDELSVRLEAATRDAEHVQSSLQAEHADEMLVLRERADRAVRALSLLQLGESQRRQGNFDEALATFVEAHRLDPDSQSINYFLGELYLWLRNLDKAIDHLDIALEQDAGFAPAIAARGYAIRLQGELSEDAEERDMLFAQAESLLLSALQLRPKLLNTEGEAVYGTLGGLYRRQGRLHEAVAAYDKAERATPQHSYPAVNLAVLHTMLGNAEVSSRYFERTRDLSSGKLDDNPYDYWARLDIALAQLHSGQSKEALESFATAAEHAPTRGPLESALATLRDLQSAPKPPPDIDRAIALIEKELK